MVRGPMTSLPAASNDLLASTDLSNLAHDALVIAAHAPLAERSPAVGPVGAAVIEALGARG